MKKLFKKLFTQPSYEQSIKRWAQIEYGTDWYWAYQYLLATGKAPKKGIHY